MSNAKDITEEKEALPPEQLPHRLKSRKQKPR